MLNILERAAYPRIHRRIWKKHRSLHFWNDVVLKTFSDDDWIKKFRMSKATFEYLYYELKLLIEKKDTRLRRAISARHKPKYFITPISHYTILTHSNTI